MINFPTFFILFFIPCFVAKDCDSICRKSLLDFDLQNSKSETPIRQNQTFELDQSFFNFKLEEINEKTGNFRIYGLVHQIWYDYRLINNDVADGWFHFTPIGVLWTPKFSSFSE
ncbi:unnamed protein product [Caenorhabditis angaria]|uniref:Neurotransmitter-gated ion-channel ligand-binding domain-containing protein n=1 Tax=Caenorhabditis angaria TaxID=860376 RepID=A0A9P1ISI9_9PELO|nr:unnamed protein product [Caenorhabditis angaria]